MATVRERSLSRVRDMVLAALAGRKARVWLFGSCARGDWMNSSDIDVAIDAAEPLPATLLAELREALEESTIPYDVDIVDLKMASSDFRSKIEQEGIAWLT